MEEARKAFMIFLSLIGATILGLLIYKLSGILTPFLIAFVLAYMFNPVVNRLSGLHIPRVIAVMMVFMFLLGLLALLLLWLIPAVAHQVSHLLASMPAVITWLQETMVPYLHKSWGLPEQLLLDFNWDMNKKFVLEHSDKIQSILGWAGNATVQSGVFLTNLLINIGILFVVLFYIMRDWVDVKKFLQGLGGHKRAAKIAEIAQQCDSVLSAFFRGQLSVMLALAIVYSLGLSLIGVQFSLLLGLLVGLFSIVPYFGSLVGLVLGTVTAWFQFHDMIPVLWVIGLFGLGQILEGMVLTPYFVGNKLGLHPVAVIFAVMAGGQLFGFVGVLVALPVAAVLMVMVKEWLEYKKYET